MALLTTNKLSEGQGTNITTASAASGGDTFTYTANTMLYIVNSGGSASTITIPVITATSFILGTGNVTKTDIVMSLAGGANAILDCRSVAYRNQVGTVSVTYSSETSINVSPFEIDRV